MANRNFNKRQALEKEVKDLYAKITIGASGAPTLTTGYGISSITRKGAGNYRLILEDKYYALKWFKAIHLASSEQDLNFQLEAEDVDGSSPYVDFFCLTGAVATDPANTSLLYIKLELKNTSSV